MKKVVTLLLISVLSVPLFSQIKFGLKAGAATATVPTYDLSTGTNNIQALKDAAWGFHAGLFVRLSLLGIYLQPEAVFATNTYEYNVTTVSGSDIMKQTFNKLEVPVLVGFKLGPIRLNAGPAAAIQIGSPKALIDDPDFENMYRGATFGYQAGLGFDLFKKLTFDARYGGSLSGKFGDAVTIGGQTFQLDQRQPSFILSVGLMF
ncbi:MAG TPA: outer membrane beta-barrel protein [Bacteroidales bacterium]|nr:outer membrane beta-barrel protein [Bacteroidales bacterium]HRR94503.1 outer membrane beta-barrel protein [Bacteroidales bacterium]HRT90536.1 outer membrane beta-barrel protein [Bacteroidales bacterium]